MIYLYKSLYSTSIGLFKLLLQKQLFHVLEYNIRSSSKNTKFDFPFQLKYFFATLSPFLTTKSYAHFIIWNQLIPL